MTEPYGFTNQTENLLSATDTVTHAQTKTYTIGGGSSPTNTPADVFHTGKAYIQVTFTGSSGGTGLVTFGFVARGHPSHAYPTLVQFSRSVAQNGAAAVVDAFEVDTSVLYDIALLSVQNADAAADISAVQALVSYKL